MWRAFEQIEIRAIQVTEAIFSRPMIALAGESIANAGGSARSILGMNLFLPEADVARGRRSRCNRAELPGPGARRVRRWLQSKPEQHHS